MFRDIGDEYFEMAKSNNGLEIREILREGFLKCVDDEDFLKEKELEKWIIIWIDK